MPSTFTTSRGYTYAYTHTPSPILSSGKPTLLLVHGFPGSARDYAAQVAHFTSKGYPTITVDMLGYGGTSKPREVEAYAHSALAKDLVELLEEEKVERVVAVGHDWWVRLGSPRSVCPFPPFSRHHADLQKSVYLPTGGPLPSLVWPTSTPTDSSASSSLPSRTSRRTRSTSMAP